MSIYRVKNSSRPGYNHDLERDLDLLMAPIKPNPDFIFTLRQRLTSRPLVTVEQIPKYRVLLLIPAGLFTAVFLIWILRRLR